MSTKDNQTKRRLPIYVVLAGLLLGSAGALMTVNAHTQEGQDAVSGGDHSYEGIMAQYDAIMASYGFMFPELTEEQAAEMDAEFAELDAEYEKVLAEGGDDLTAEQEDALAELDKKRDAILESYGFKFPKLTDAQVAEMDEKLGWLAAKFMEYLIQSGYCHFGDPTPELEERFELVDKQFNAILQEYGLKHPELTDAQLAEMNKRLSPLDKEYEEIISKFDGELTESEAAELKLRLNALDAETASVMAEFGIAGPQLTEAQSAELDKRMYSLYEQYMAILIDSADCS